ncbi:DNA repair protein RAD5 [Apostasia shenzhenica]|uniref:RING-type E3 ubiquitin transferase n=1 Tax=Apostasia shenzhenica TaxID=1088818 RepID=A0A2I0A3H4_9ASPA|nr:DNA repair protein RAD5 [Apostasia shenzhenica]
MADAVSASPADPRSDYMRPPSMEGETKESILSPGFRSMAAMAGWDEEALLLATHVVDDTPVRESRSRKRTRLQLSSPATTVSTKKWQSRRQPADSIQAVVLCLDDDDDEASSSPGFFLSFATFVSLLRLPFFDSAKFIENKEVKEESDGVQFSEEKKVERGGEEAANEKACEKGGPSMDRLREELSCAICLEICYEPSTTPCGHSFCMKCLTCAADKCGKRCPKCRQLISNTRSCTVSTNLWNTIQLLFPGEVEARKKATIETPRTEISSSFRSNSGSIMSSGFSSRVEVMRALEGGRSRNRRLIRSQAEDAALALRLQREEFLEAFRASRAQFRAMASEAFGLRIRRT